MTNKTLRNCKKEHKYYKSSDCLTFPVCEVLCQPRDGFLSLLSAPQGALKAVGVTSPERVSAFSERELPALHGLRPSAISKLKAALTAKQLTLKKMIEYDGTKS